MKKILLLSIGLFAILMADITLTGEQLIPLTEPVAETTPTATEPTAPTITTGEYTIVPGLYGFGTDTRAAYGGTVDPVILHVDRLTGGATSGSGTSGSFEWCVNQNYPRIVVFDVSGVIITDHTITIWNPYLSIYGQTAPDNIVISGWGLQIATNDVVIQHLAVRNVAEALNADCIATSSASNVVIDHCSSTWGEDECMSISSSSNITFSNCIVGEAAGIDEHQYGSLNSGANLVHVGNLYIHNHMRSPQTGYAAEMAVYNSLTYNWRHSNMYFGTYEGHQELTYVGNETVAGVDTDLNNAWTAALVYTKDHGMPEKDKILYMADNIKNNGTAVAGYDVFYSGPGEAYLVGDQLIPNNFVPLPASETKASVLAKVGARPGQRDAVDTRLVNDVLNGTGSIITTIPTLPSYTKLTVPFVPVAKPHDMYNEHYTNLEHQLHQLAAAVETSK